MEPVMLSDVVARWKQAGLSSEECASLLLQAAAHLVPCRARFRHAGEAAFSAYVRTMMDAPPELGSLPEAS